MLHTQRLQLRRFSEDDAEALFLLDADPEVMRFISGGAGTPREVIEEDVLPRFIREQDAEEIFGYWAAERCSAFIGWYSLRRVDGRPGEATLGYRLRRKAWGQGLATEGARLLMDRGFQLGALDKVLASTYQDNHASIAVMRKLGLDFQRSFSMTSAELRAMDTAALETSTPFPGLDVEYAIHRTSWLAGRSS